MEDAFLSAGFRLIADRGIKWLEALWAMHVCVYACGGQHVGFCRRYMKDGNLPGKKNGSGVDHSLAAGESAGP